MSNSVLNSGFATCNPMGKGLVAISLKTILTKSAKNVPDLHIKLKKRFFARNYIVSRAIAKGHVCQPPPSWGCRYGWRALLTKHFLLWIQRNVQICKEKSCLPIHHPSFYGGGGLLPQKCLARNGMKCPDLQRKIILPTPYWRSSDQFSKKRFLL